MSRFVLEGGSKLQGDFEVAGMKNAATPLLAASLLLHEPVTFHRIPQIIDVERMLELMKGLGTLVERQGSSVTIDPVKCHEEALNEVLVKRLRSSVLLLGPLLSKYGKVSFPVPGGCYIGARPIDTHIDGFRQLGIVSEQNDFGYVLERKEKPLTRVILSEFSVTATENMILYASTLRQKTTIRMAAAEPHVQELCRFLVACGVQISGIGTHELVVEGGTLTSCKEWTNIPDQIEIGTIAIAAAVTQGNVLIKPVIPNHLDAIITKLTQAGVQMELTNDTLRVNQKNKLKHFSLQALPYPGFPTDLQAPMAVLATQAEGLSLIHDPMYDARFSYIQELSRMGAQAVVCDPHRVLISGKTQLKGEKIKSFDLRAGVTLILAGLVARGETVIEDAEMVDRGYEHIDERLRSLGASIKRETD